MVNVDGIKTLDEEDNSPITLAVHVDMAGDEKPEKCPPIQYEILMAALARAVPHNAKEVPVYRVSGVKPS